MIRIFIKVCFESGFHSLIRQLMQQRSANIATFSPITQRRGSPTVIN